MSLTNITGDGFARGGEKRGRALENVTPQAAISDVSVLSSVMDGW